MKQLNYRRKIGVKNRIEFLIKKNKFVQASYKIIFSFLFKIISIFIRIDKKLILFTGHGGGINDSPYYIYNKMIDDPFFMDYKLVWGVKQIKGYDNSSYRVVRVDSIRYFIISMKATIWIASVNIERGLNYKRKHTFYLNTWHGIPLKTIGNSAPGRNDYNFSSIDCFLISSEYERLIYTRDFNVKETSISKIGLPRNESLYTKYDENEINQIKSSIGIKNMNKKIILYAPTWRDNKKYEVGNRLQPRINFTKWEQELSDEYIILLRLHPYTSELYGIYYNDFFIDCTNYNNVNDLLQIVDVLITDYSSIMFDYSITRKPFICLGYDYEKYNNDRGLYFDFKSKYPELFVGNESELFDKIKASNFKFNENIIDNFKNEFIETGKNAVMDSINIIKSKINRN
jgi:CDP-glycerol glycerophosphotransferase